MVVAVATVLGIPFSAVVAAAVLTASVGFVSSVAGVVAATVAVAAAAVY